MKEDLEAKLEEIVRVGSEKAAIEEWSAIQANHDVALYNYRFDHVKHVVGVALHIAQEVGADEQVILLAAWLHDIAKPGMGDIQKHGEAGAEKAGEILRENSINPDVIDRVCDVIRKHVGLTLKKPVQPLEAQVLWDADKITKLGAIGLIHYLVNGIRINPGFLLSEVSIQVNEFLMLGDRIVESMNTKPGKAIAEKRLDTLKHFASALETELKLTKAEE
ncbi:MAG: HD domain-containing protein [Candidatus Thorarchaeota archaeon]|jgi:putative nucleotidyltransferase with HDIG domain